MKILFTGASSFTGFWFVQELVEAGHEVDAYFRSPYATYQGLRKERIDQLLPLCRTHFNLPFGSDPFLEQLQKEVKFDLFCHHAAEVSNYKSVFFDPVTALGNNTRNLSAVLTALAGAKIILTGSVFEPNEGSGHGGVQAVSPYGLSKGLTSQFFKYYAALHQMPLGKFVIPNPFGPFEEERFTTYLVKSWFNNEVPAIHTPEYVRDNVPVSLLAKGYRHFAETMDDTSYRDFHPSFYAESQENFTKRFSHEMAVRLKRACPFVLKPQPMLIEPKIRINHDVLNPTQLNWSESESWNQLAEFYQKRFSTQCLTR